MRAAHEENPAAGDIVLYRCLELSFNANISILDSAYFLIERVLARHFVLYCRVRSSCNNFRGISDDFYAFREAKHAGENISFNMVVNPGLILRNITKQLRMENCARIIQRVWRKTRFQLDR